jgi:VanZ family protein
MLRLLIWFKPYSRYFLTGWVLFILVFSSIPSLPTIKIHTAKSEIRLDYLIHLVEYGILGFLAFLSYSGGQFSPGLRRFALLTVCLILFAFLDEFHQKFIPGRTYNPIDLYSNWTGIIVALVFCMVVFRVASGIAGKEG